jgi:uncharacterized protein with FMN-binding domain
MAQPGSGKKMANSLVALSSAAVLAVYSAGYARTRTAADRFAQQSVERRPAPQSLPVADVMPPARSLPIIAPLPEPKPVTEVAAVAPKPTVSAPAAPVMAKAVPEPKVEIPAAPPAPVAPAAPAAPVIPAVLKDGKYQGWGTCRHGDIQATVVVEGGKILSAEISDCQTRYSCDVIEKLPPQVAQRQSPDVDHVSGATQSADAFYWAVVSALRQAQ